MKSFKRIAIISMSLLALTACGKGGYTGLKEPPKKEVIHVWLPEASYAPLVQKAAASYSMKHKTVQVQVEVKKAEEYRKGLFAGDNEEGYPDLFLYENSMDLHSMVEGKLMQPLNGLVSEEFKKRTDFDKNRFEGVNALGNKVYWVPGAADGKVQLVYNEDILKKDGVKVPQSFQDLLNAASRLTEDGKGRYYGISFAGDENPFRFWMKSSMEEGGITAYNYKEGRYDFLPYRLPLQFIQEILKSRSEYPGSTGMNTEEGLKLFVNGNTAICFLNEKGLKSLKEMKTDVKWKTAPLPTPEGKVAGSSARRTEYAFALSASSGYTKEAVSFLEELYSAENLKKLYKDTGLLPVSKELWEEVKGEYASTEYHPLSAGDFLPAPPLAFSSEDADALIWRSCLPNGPEMDTTLLRLNKEYKESMDSLLKEGRTKRLIIPEYDPANPGASAKEYKSE